MPPDDQLKDIRLLTDGLPVLLNPHLAHPTIRVERRAVVVCCKKCIQASLDEFNGRYDVVMTAPPCLFDKTTGQLVDLPEEEEQRSSPLSELMLSSRRRPRLRDLVDDVLDKPPFRGSWGMEPPWRR